MSQHFWYLRVKKTQPCQIQEALPHLVGVIGKKHKIVFSKIRKNLIIDFLFFLLKMYSIYTIFIYRLSSSRITEASDHIYARVQPKDKRISTASSASMASAVAASATLQPPNLLDLIPPPPTYPPSPRSPLIPRPRSKQ